jgi:beta-glucanase (GH16 family)
MRLLFPLALTALALACGSADSQRTLPPLPTDPAATERKLVWADEFDKAGLPDPARWGYDVGGSGWGNNELQYYTKSRTENARVEGGNLIIEARKEPFENRNYTSARLITQNTATWTYGRIEVRAKLPAGRGTWPAIWMLGKNISTVNWPLCGEIDIMEHVGYDEGVVHGTIHSEAYNHTKGTQKEGKINVPDATSAFHVYAIDWSAGKIEFYVDDKTYYTAHRADLGSQTAQWPFGAPFFLLLNVAVGGNWGGQKGVDESIWPRRMEVDYVRVYQ